MGAEWEGWIHSLTSPVAGRVRSLWSLARRTVPHMPPPTMAGVFDEDGDEDLRGMCQMVWDYGRHHFVVDVMPDGRGEWFYMDRDAQLTCGGNFGPLFPIG